MTKREENRIKKLEETYRTWVHGLEWCNLTAIGLRTTKHGVEHVSDREMLEAQGHMLCNIAEAISDIYRVLGCYEKTRDDHFWEHEKEIIHKLAMEDFEKERTEKEQRLKRKTEREAAKESEG